MLVLAATGFISVTTELLPVGLLMEISHDFAVTDSAAGLLVAAYSVVIVVTVVPLARVTWRVPRRLLMVASLIAFLFGTLILVVSPNFQIALLGRLFSGAAHGVLWAALAPYVFRVVPTKDVAKGLAVMFSGSTLGLAAGTPLGTALGQLIGWRPAFLALACATAIVAILVRWLLPEVAPDAVDGTRISLSNAVRVPGVWPQLTAWTLLVIAHFGLMTYIGAFFAGRDLPSTVTTTALSALGVAALAGIWIAGMTPHSLNRQSLAISGVLMAACYVVLAVSPLNSLWATVVVIVWGTVQSASNVYHQSSVLALAGEHSETVNSIVVVAIQVGISAGSIFGGASAQALGVVHLPWALLLPLLGSIVLLRSRQPETN